MSYEIAEYKYATHMKSVYGLVGYRISKQKTLAARQRGQLDFNILQRTQDG